LSNILFLSTIDCPSSVKSKRDKCQNALATIYLDLQDENSPQDVVEEYQFALLEAISNGRLQDELINANPDAPVTVYIASDGTFPPSMAPSAVPAIATGLSIGAIVGISIGAVLLLIIPLGYMSYKNNKAAGDPDYQPATAQATPKKADAAKKAPTPATVQLANVEDSEDSEDDDEDDDDDDDDDAEPSKDEPPATAAVAGGAAAVLGAAAADYGGKTQQEKEAELKAMEAGEDMMAEPGLDKAVEEETDEEEEKEKDQASTDAGSSGWSSSAGMTSANTGSMDEIDPTSALSGVVLAKPKPVEAYVYAAFFLSWTII
jgi:hypothetical protein